MMNAHIYKVDSSTKCIYHLIVTVNSRKAVRFVELHVTHGVQISVLFNVRVHSITSEMENAFILMNLHFAALTGYFWPSILS